MNAAAALVAANQAPDIKEGVCIAEKTIDNGKALDKLDDLIRFSQSLSKGTHCSADR
jgi:anthranilate phosphoribosyltransferase